MNIMKVVAGAWISTQARVLMGKRPDDKLRPGMWELPGGKIEARETPEEALRREWMEELNLEVQVGPLIAVCAFEVEFPIIVELYQLWPYDLAGKSLRSTAHSNVQWWEPSYAIERLPCSPAFYLHYPRLRDYMREKKDLIARQTT